MKQNRWFVNFRTGGPGIPVFIPQNKRTVTPCDLFPNNSGSAELAMSASGTKRSIKQAPLSVDISGGRADKVISDSYRGHFNFSGRRTFELSFDRARLCRLR